MYDDVCIYGAYTNDAVFLDTQVSLVPNLPMPVRWSVGDTFEFPLYQRLWLFWM